MAYKNTQAKFHSLDTDANFVDNVIRVLQGDTLEPHTFMVRFDYVIRTSIDLIKENGFTIKKRQEADDIPQKL